VNGQPGNNDIAHGLNKLAGVYPDVVKQLSTIADKYRQAFGDGLTKTEGSEVRAAGKLN